MIVYSGIEVWNAPISGTTAEYTAPSLAPLLAGASKLLVQVRTAQGAGSSPTLTVDLERSNDGLNYASIAANALITNLAVSTSGVTNAFAQWDTTAGDNLFGCFLRLKISLGGTTPSASVRVTVTGRSRRSRQGTAGSLPLASNGDRAKGDCSCSEPSFKAKTSLVPPSLLSPNIPSGSSSALFPPFAGRYVEPTAGPLLFDEGLHLPPGAGSGRTLETACRVFGSTPVECGAFGESCRVGEGCCSPRFRDPSGLGRGPFEPSAAPRCWPGSQGDCIDLCQTRCLATLGVTDKTDPRFADALKLCLVNCQTAYRQETPIIICGQLARFITNPGAPVR